MVAIAIWLTVLCPLPWHAALPTFHMVRSHTGIHYRYVKMSFSTVYKQCCLSWGKTEKVTAKRVKNHLLERFLQGMSVWQKKVCVCVLVSAEGVRWCERGYRLKWNQGGLVLWCHRGDYFNRTHPLGPWRLMASVARLGWQRHALYERLINYSRVLSHHNASVHGCVCLTILLGEWDHRSQVIMTGEFS